ncbi:hypothetical protein [Rhodococcus sp. SJ-2]
MAMRKWSTVAKIVAGAAFGFLLVVGARALQRLDTGPAVGAVEWETDPIGPDELAG